MSLLRTPESLPRAYIEIWKALRDADGRSTSRQALAEQLGVSTHTLQRILVRGDVPVFSDGASTRVVHSWTRTLTRVASRLGHDPRAWIENVGIPWTAEIRRISDRSIQVSRASRPRSEKRAPIGDATGGVLRVGIVDRPTFGAFLTEPGGSFLEAIVRRILRSIDPEATIQIELTREDEALAEMERPTSRFDLAAGILDTTARRRRGLDFVAIPGWHERLDAVCVARREIAPSLSRWSAWNGPTCTVPVLAANGSAAHAYVSGASGLPEPRLRILPSSDRIANARALVEEAQHNPEGAAILVSDGDSIGGPPGVAVTEILEGDAELARAFTAVSMGDAATAPAFPLAIATIDKGPISTHLIRRAMEQEFFRVGVIATAHLYAAFAAAFHRAIEDFPQANPAFRQAVCDFLVALVRPPEYARTLISIAWHPHLDAALRGELDPTRLSVSPHQCQSCSASLDDGVHGGVSDHYCRFCSDEQGRLRPREQVQGVIARWLQGWQGESRNRKRCDERRSSCRRCPPGVTTRSRNLRGQIAVGGK